MVLCNKVLNVSFSLKSTKPFNMKKTILFWLFLLNIVFAAMAQQPLLTPQQMPNPIRFLPPPPDTLSAAFAYDKSQYQWGKVQRQDSVRSGIAVRDADWGMATICREFSEPFGMELSKERTPAIYNMLYIGLISTDMVGKLPKDYYNRTRPFVYYNEPTLIPGHEESLRDNGSFPSGHTIEGWSAALLLVELNPDRADTILARGYMYGESRVIAGYHWQSDVNAGMIAASAAVARLHADKRFERLMRKARREYQRLSSGN